MTAQDEATTMPPKNKIDLGTFLGDQGNSSALPKGPAERAPDEHGRGTQ